MSDSAASSANNDSLQHFIFENSDIRGEVISLAEAYQQVRANNSRAEGGLPEPVLRLLGEFMAAVSLLSGTLKFEGVLTLQAKGSGPMPMIMAEASYQKGLRAAVQVDAASQIGDAPSFTELLGQGGLLAILIQPDKGERYQGIVPLEKPELAACLEDYFAQSEQLATRIWLAADQAHAGGLMLQALPQQLADAEHNECHWQHLVALADTIKNDELLGLDAHTILHRLFHEEQLRLFDPQPVAFACSCSEQRCASAIMAMGQAEAEQIVAEQDLITMDCHFCGQQYQFGPEQLAKLFGDQAASRH
ncbi:MAG: Hsp33 family molecular chaperone HslO [Cellvibrionaceae bacterium]|nr:Hsp33 family molecular chaperone HslO [Cellvibrionaceae bacterium]